MSNVSDRLGFGCLALFVTPFAIVGVVTFYLCVQHIVESLQAYTWDPVEAEVLSAYSSSRRSGSDDGETHYMTGSYRYEYNGQTYTGKRINIDDEGGFGLVYDYRAKVMLDHKGYKKPLIIRVNPNNPQQAVAFPAPVFDYLFFLGIFVVTFGGVGFGGYTALFYGMATLKEENKLKERYPTEPWKWKVDWEDGVITCSKKGMLIVAWVFCIFWNAISSPVLLIAPKELMEGNFWILVALIFPLVGAGLFYWAVLTTIQWYKFGSIRFRMEKNPGVIGGTLSGSIELDTPIRPDGSIMVRLHCLETYDVGSSTSQRTLWEAHKETPKSTSFGSQVVNIPVRFQIPYECAQTSQEARIDWKLSVHAEVPGVDLNSEFTVPVYRTPQSDSAISAERIEEERSLEFGDVPVDLEELGFTVYDYGPSQFIIQIPPIVVRRPGYAFCGFLFTLVCCIGFGILIYTDVHIFFPILMGFFCALCLYGTFETLVKRVSMEAQNSKLLIRTSRLGIGRRREFNNFEIESINITKTAESQMGSKRYEHLSITLKKKGKTGEITLASDFKDRAVAEHIRRRLRETLNLQGSE